MPKRRTMEDAAHLFAGDAGKCWHLPPGCGGPHGNGYYTITVSGERWYAHRLSYTLLVGEIPDGLDLDHLCHTRDESCPGGDTCPHRACVNPTHLEPVTSGVNALRGLSQVADNARKTECDKGHLLVQKGSDPARRYCPVCRMDSRISRGETSGNGHLRDRTHCPANHEYTEENTYLHLNPDGSACCRMCRTCMRDKRKRKRGGPHAACPVCLGLVGLMWGGARLQRHYADGTTLWCDGSGSPAAKAA